MKNFMNKNLLYEMMMKSLIKLPTPININLWWNIGSLLGICLLTQIITGFLLSLHYCPHTNFAFESVMFTMHYISYGWLMRYAHMNGATFFFILIYMHIGRNLYYNTYSNKYTWITGVILLLMLMITAFVGYVLPWGQMSYWGATVITNLFTVFPYGQEFLYFLWGDFSITNATLNRFYSFHFIIPLMMMMMMMIHLFFLHEKGSSNPMGLSSNIMKIPFHSYFSIKDLLGFNFYFFIFIMLILMKPFMFCDPENFIQVNEMKTPNHIQPEWYFLFAYAILRVIPSKFGGVIALFCSVLILLILPFYNFNLIQSNKFYYINKIMFWIFVNTFIILTHVGSMRLIAPFITQAQIAAIFYFSYYLLSPMIHKLYDKMLF